AEDGIRDFHVTGVQTCALPISQNTPVESIPILRRKLRQVLELDEAVPGGHDYKAIVAAFNSLPREELFGTDPEQLHKDIRAILRSEERRVGKERKAQITAKV